MSVLLQSCQETTSDISKNLKILKTTQLTLEVCFLLDSENWEAESLIIWNCHLITGLQNGASTDNWYRFTYSSLYWIYRYFYAITQNMHIFEQRNAWSIGSKHWKITQQIPFCSNSVFENFPTFPNSPGWITEAARESMPKIFQGVHDSEDSEWRSPILILQSLIFCHTSV